MNGWAVHLDSGFEAGRQIGNWLAYDNEERPYSQQGGDRTPLKVSNLGLTA